MGQDCPGSDYLECQECDLIRPNSRFQCRSIGCDCDCDRDLLCSDCSPFLFLDHAGFDGNNFDLLKRGVGSDGDAVGYIIDCKCR